MIRKWDTEDTAPLLALWLDSTIHAHPFISESYWRDSVAVVRDVYLPAASTWVWEQDGELKGFVSVLDSRFVGALFVAPGATRQGIGRALLDEIKQHYAWLSLEVYQKNESAVSFYHAQASGLKTAHGRTILSTRRGLCVGRRIKCRKRQRRAGIFLQPRQGGVPGTAVAQPGCRNIFG